MHELQWRFDKFEYFYIKSINGMKSNVVELTVYEKPYRVGGSFYKMQDSGLYFFQYYYGCAILDTNTVSIKYDCLPCDRNLPMIYLGTLVIADDRKGPEMAFTTAPDAKLSKGFSCP